MSPDFDKINAYMSLTPEERRASDRAAFLYLPTDGLMELGGWVHTHIGRYERRPADPEAARYALGFYSQSSTAVLQVLNPGIDRTWRVIGSQVINTDEQLAQFLAARLPTPDPLAT
jgi:hypothetical protein